MHSILRSGRRITAAFVLFFTLSLSIAAIAEELSRAAREQIAALLAEKESRTPAQKKIDSRLLYAVKMQRGEVIAAGVPRLETALDLSVDSVVVDMTATVSDDLLERIRDLGGEVLDVHFRFRSIRAQIPFQAIEALAAEPAVVFVQPKQEVTTWREVPLPPGPPRAAAAAVSPALRSRLGPGFEERAERVRAQLLGALAASGTGGGVTNKMNTSEGYVTHRMDLARSTFGYTGSGVKVGVLSDGVDSLAALQASGDLPSVTVLPGQAGTGDEGTAMLEIIYDLAPGAELYFATAFNSIASFAQNILDLKAAGCTVIVDDVFYFVETPFQKGQAPSVASNTNGGLVIQSVNTVTAGGALYFSSAGNSGNLDDGQSGVWEGDFVDGGAAGPPITGAGNLHSFGIQTYNVITTSGGPVNLYWSDPLGGSSNDYDLFRLNSTGTTVQVASTNIQDGTQDPYEQMTSALNSRIVIVKWAGAARFLHLNTNRGRLSIGTAGQTHGHSASPGPYAFGVAATPAAAAIGAPPNPVGPYPNPFNSTNTVELFSSDGPRRYFFNADSTAITPGNFSATGGEVQQKPDLTAADGVSCAAPGFNPFFGTSAAAPHAAAIAAVVRSAAPAATQAQWKTYLLTGAIDIEAPGVDRDSGVGILDAYSAVNATGAGPVATLLPGTPTVLEAAGDGDGVVEPGECASLTMPLTNGNATAGATAISATLTTSTPGVTIEAGTSAYPNIAGGATAANSSPFRFRLATSVTCPLVIEFTLTVSLTGGPSPQVITFPVRVGKPPVIVSTALDTTPPPASAVYTGTTGSETPRLFRTGVSSSCAVPKTNPGTSGTSSYLYDAYVFQNCSAGPACISVAVSHPGFNNPAGSQLFSVAYSPSFDPNSVSTNYLADAGGSGALMSYSFNVSAGQTFVVVVNEVNAGVSASYPYTLTVDGACFPCSTYTTTYSCCPSGSLAVTAPATVGEGSPNRTASVPFHASSTYAWTVGNGTITGGQGTNQITFTAGTAGTPLTIAVTETTTGGCQQSGNATVTVAPAGSAVLFYTVTPCRVIDTRNPNGPQGGPVLAPSSVRTFPIASSCGVPASARAVSVNLAVVAAGSGHFRIYPGNGMDPGTSNINFSAGQIRANNTILLLATDGSGTLNVVNGSGGSNDLILDVNGYFQ